MYTNVNKYMFDIHLNSYMLTCFFLLLCARACGQTNHQIQKMRRQEIFFPGNVFVSKIEKKKSDFSRKSTVSNVFFFKYNFSVFPAFFFCF